MDSVSESTELTNNKKLSKNNNIEASKKFSEIFKKKPTIDDSENKKVQFEHLEKKGKEIKKSKIDIYSSNKKVKVGEKEDKKFKKFSQIYDNRPVINIDSNKVATCKVINILGIDVFFPYTPYKCQLNYMESVIKALKERKYAALESPTGTGKTLCLLCSVLGYLYSKQNNKRISKNKDYVPIKIYYTSRTHTQLENVLKELEKTPYLPLTCFLSSRKYLCINESIKEKGSEGNNIDVLCKVALNNKIKFDESKNVSINEFLNKKINKNDEQKPNISNIVDVDFFYKNSICPFSTSANFKNSRDLFNIEDLIEISREEMICPFYKQRKLHSSSQLIILPYNYMFNGVYRASLNINVSRNIIIIDEAHNIDSVCDSVNSLEITHDKIQTWINTIKLLKKEISSSKNTLKDNINSSKMYKKSLKRAGGIENIDNVIKILTKINDNLLSFKMKAEFEKKIEIKEFFEFLFGKELENYSLDEEELKIQEIKQKEYDKIKNINYLSDEEDNDNSDNNIDLDKIKESDDSEKSNSESEKSNKSNSSLDKEIKKNKDISRGLNEDNTKRFFRICQYYVEIADLLNIKNSKISDLLDTFRKISYYFYNYKDFHIGRISSDDYIGNECICYLLNEDVKSGINNQYKGYKNKRKKVIQYEDKFNVKLVIQCMSYGQVFNRITRKHPHTIIMTSGTLTPIESYEKELKLSFPIKLSNSHVIHKNQIKMCFLKNSPFNKFINFNFNYNNKDNEYMIYHLGLTICKLINVTKGGVFVFFGSKQYLNMCLDIWENGDKEFNVKCLSNSLFENRDDFFADINIWKNFVDFHFNNKNSQYRCIQDLISANKKIFIDPSSNRNNEYSKNEINSNENDENEVFLNIVEKFRQSFLKNVNNSKFNGSIMYSVIRGISSEGIDLPHEMVRLVIIVGIPYANYQDSKIRLKKEFLQKKSTKSNDWYSQWYEQSTVKTINQAIGRVIRDKNDYGGVVLIDERYDIKCKYSSSVIRNNLSSWTKNSCFDFSDDQIFFELKEFFELNEKVKVGNEEIYTQDNKKISSEKLNLDDKVIKCKENVEVNEFQSNSIDEFIDIDNIDHYIN